MSRRFTYRQKETLVRADLLLTNSGVAWHIAIGGEKIVLNNLVSMGYLTKHKAENTSSVRYELTDKGCEALKEIYASRYRYPLFHDPNGATPPTTERGNNVKF